MDYLSAFSLSISRPNVKILSIVLTTLLSFKLQRLAVSRQELTTFVNALTNQGSHKCGISTHCLG